MIKFNGKKAFKKGAVVVLAAASLMGGGMQPMSAYANTCPGNNSGNSGVTCNETPQIRVYLNWQRSPRFTGAHAGVRALTNESRRLRVNARWYDTLDMPRESSGWHERPNVVPVGQRIARNTYWGDARVVARSENGRFRTSAQRMRHNETAWNITTAGTVRQSRSWNMR